MSKARKKAAVAEKVFGETNPAEVAAEVFAAVYRTVGYTKDEVKKELEIVARFAEVFRGDRPAAVAVAKALRAKAKAL